MKIERINENQIRCILTKSDLIERHLKISELAYGSEKAKELFRDMMEQASMDFGFNADEIPLMIEAIPTSRDSIILVITKVDDPEELERRFSNYAPVDYPDTEDYYETDEYETDLYDTDDFIEHFDLLDELESAEDDKFIPLYETLQPNKKKKKALKKKLTISDESRVFSFSGLEDIIHVAHLIGEHYEGKSTLWKDDTNHRYYLYMTHSSKMLNYKKVCDKVGEYGKSELVSFATKAYFEEHYTVIIRDKALLTLSIM